MKPCDNLQDAPERFKFSIVNEIPYVIVIAILLPSVLSCRQGGRGSSGDSTFSTAKLAESIHLDSITSINKYIMKQTLVLLLIVSLCSCNKNDSPSRGGSTSDSTGGTQTGSTASYSSLIPYQNFYPNPTSIFTLAGAIASKYILVGEFNPTTRAYGDSAAIFDTTTQSWSGIKLSANHYYGCSATAASKVLFAGGFGDQGTVATAVVDIFNGTSGQWANGNLSVARFAMGTASLGDTLAFAGGSNNGNVFNTVDFYDASTGTWSIGELSSTRFDIAGASGGTKMIFAGGYDQNGNVSSVIDLYDVQTKEWTTASLGTARTEAVAAGADGKIIVAGGYDNNFNQVNALDVYDTKTGKWTTGALPAPEAYGCAIPVGNLILLPRSTDTIDIYNADNGAWSYILQSQSAYLSSGAVSGNLIMFSGSYGANLSISEFYHAQ